MNGLSRTKACATLQSDVRLYRPGQEALPRKGRGSSTRIQDAVTSHIQEAAETNGGEGGSPSVLSDTEVPSPVSPLSAVPGRRPKRLWNFSETAGVCHSMSAKRAARFEKNNAISEKTKNVIEKDRHMRLCTGLQGVHLPAGLDSKYLCDVVIP